MSMWVDGFWVDGFWVDGFWQESGGGPAPPTLTGTGISEISAFQVYASYQTDSPFDGTAYAVVTASATTPSAAQVIAGQDHTGAAALGAASAAVSNSILLGPLGGLTHNTGGYYTHCVQVGVGGNSNVITSSVSATTDDADPTASASGETTGVGTIDPGFNTGTMYWVVTTSPTPPSGPQVRAGQDHTGSAAADSGSEAATVPTRLTMNATGLTTDVEHWFHFQYRNQNNHDSPVVTSAGFTPAAAPDAVGAGHVGVQISIGV